MDKAEDNGGALFKYDKKNCVMLHILDDVNSYTVKVTQVRDGWKDPTRKYK